MKKHERLVHKFLVSDFCPHYNLYQATIELFESRKQFSKSASHISNCGVFSGDKLLVSRKQAIEHTERFLYSINLYYQYIAIHNGLTSSQFLAQPKNYEFKQFTVEEISYYLMGTTGYQPKRRLDFLHTLGYFFIRDVCRNYRDFLKMYLRE